MNSNYKTALIALLAALTVAIPGGVTVKSQREQLDVERTNSQRLQSNVQKLDTDLYWSNLHNQLNTDALNRQSDEISKLRRQTDQLQKDLQAARQPKPPPASVTVRAQAETKAQTQSQPQARTGDCEQYRSIVAAYFPASQVNNALLTMRRESGCNRYAVSPVGDYGLMQIHFAAHSGKVGGNAKALFDPSTNLKVAAQIWRESGWCPWVAVRGTLC